MRKVLIVAGLVIGVAPAALSAQADAPVVLVEFDAAGRPIDPGRSPTCAETRPREHARFAEDAAKRAAAGDPPLEEEEPWPCIAFDGGEQAEPVTPSASWSLPAATNAENSMAWVTRRSPPARPETAEEFYNRTAAPNEAPGFDDAVALRREPGRTQERASTVREAELGNGRIRNETSVSCTETLFERTCSTGGSVTFSSGNDDGAAARALLESMRRDD